MTKNVLSITLALILVLNTFLLTSFASESDNHASWKLECSETDPHPGDVIEIDVFLQTDYATNAFGALIVYDSNYYEPAQVNESENIVIADDIAGYGSKTVIMSEKRSDSVAQTLYDSSYTQEMRAQYSIAWFSFVFRASTFENPTVDLIPSFETARKVATLKLRVRSDAPDDAKGIIRMDPVYIQTEKDNAKHTFAARASSAVIGECDSFVKFGQTTDVREAVIYFGDISLGAADGSDALIDGQSGMICTHRPMNSAADVLDLLQVGDGAAVDVLPSGNGYGTGASINVLLYGKIIDSYKLAVYGDLTGDGFVDSFDCAVIGEYINTFESPDDEARFCAADVFCDGYLDSIDLSYVLYLAIFEQ